MDVSSSLWFNENNKRRHESTSVERNEHLANCSSKRWSGLISEVFVTVSAGVCAYVRTCFTCLLCLCLPLPLLKQDNLNECHEAALSYMRLSVAVIAKDNCRQNNVHAEEGSWVIIRSGLEARNKCPCVIDYTLQANEINRAWIDSVGEESCQRGICSRVQWLYWHAHIQRPSEREQAALLAENGAVQSGSMRLKSNASDGTWQVGYLLLNNHR